MIFELADAGQGGSDHAASCASSGTSCQVRQARVTSFPAVAKSLSRHSFTSQPFAAWQLDRVASCSQETGSIIRAEIFAYAWFAGKS